MCLLSRSSVQATTFLHHQPPSLSPVSQLLAITPLDLGPLLETQYQLAAEPVTIVNTLHCAPVVPCLSRDR